MNKKTSVAVVAAVFFAAMFAVTAVVSAYTQYVSAQPDFTALQYATMTVMISLTLVFLLIAGIIGEARSERYH